MMHIPQKSGHTLHADHIENPRHEYFVSFHAPAYFNILFFEAGTRCVRVLAETPEGALRVAKYHHFNGDDFELLPASIPLDEAEPSSV